MDERRDLVDREELRRRIKNSQGVGTEKWEEGFRTGITQAARVLDAMPAVECPRGWTRDEVLAELDAAEARGDEAVVEYLDTSIGKWYGTYLDNWINPEVPRLNVRVRVTEQAPEWVPLTQLVGRTIDGCSGAVNRFHVDRYHAKWWALHDLEFQDRPFPEGTLNLETGRVAVRPKAAG